MRPCRAILPIVCRTSIVTIMESRKAGHRIVIDGLMILISRKGRQLSVRCGLHIDVMLPMAIFLIGNVTLVADVGVTVKIADTLSRAISGSCLISLFETTESPEEACRGAVWLGIAVEVPKNKRIRRPGGCRFIDTGGATLLGSRKH